MNHLLADNSHEIWSLVWFLNPYDMGLVTRKPVFRVSDKASFKPVSSVTETSWKIEISPVASLDMLLSNTQITKALIRLRVLLVYLTVLLFYL